MVDRVRVWDRVVRMSHWTLALLVILNLLMEDEFEFVHMWVGYLAVGVVVIRLSWGLFRGGYASLKYFMPTLEQTRHEVLGLLGRPSSEGQVNLGHSALGGIMMCLLMVHIIFLGLTGSIASFGGYAWSSVAEEVHEVLSSTLTGLLIVHVGAALVVSLQSNRNLVLSMITGWKKSNK